MSGNTTGTITRRGFIATAAASLVLKPLKAVLRGAAIVSDSSRLSDVGAAQARAYRTLNGRDAAVVERIVDLLCPADHLTPSGSACGLAAAVDEDLAGAPLQAVRFKEGLAALIRIGRADLGVEFTRAADADAAQFLGRVFAGDVDGNGPLTSWAHEVLDPVVICASFTGSLYHPYSNRVFWKLTGQAGVAT